jgi:hypothetical protein
MGERKFREITLSNDFIYLFGCLTRGSWPPPLPPLESQTQTTPFSHSHRQRPLLTGGSSQTQAEQILHISLYLKHPTSYVRCLWSPLLGSRGVLGWPGITVVSGQILIFIPYLGKSTFLFYLLLHRLEKRLPTAVQLRAEQYLLFDEEGPTTYPISATPKRLRACWALVDSNSHVSLPCSAFGAYAQRVFLMTCPKPERWRGWSKRHEGLLIIMDLPTVPEIAAIV